jgi:hypothetical protein
MRERTAQSRRVGRERQATIRQSAQAFLFNAAAHALQTLGRNGLQPLCQLGHKYGYKRFLKG